MQDKSIKYQKWVRIWLLAGVIMVLIQIMLGGITRLTGSGLSITRWEIVTGTLPPLNHQDWVEEFDLYKKTPQYQLINKGMSLDQFRFIYFWEYVHRLWARSMGFVFLLPFLWFLFKGALTRKLIQRLMVVVALAALAAVFGWIMVASGLVKRPWVNAYKLTIHLGLGITLFLYLIHTWWKQLNINGLYLKIQDQKRIRLLILLVIIQVCFGGFVSGMKAALAYPTWPKMNAEWIPSILFDTSHWNMDAVLLYDQAGFMPALVQFIHRCLAYIILLLMVSLGVKWMRSGDALLKPMGLLSIGIVIVQVLLGILTLVGSKGEIPVFLGAFHQIIGILLLTFLFYIRFRFRKGLQMSM